MKKLLCILVFCAIGSVANSQSAPALKTTSTPTVIVDTLHYYLNKYYFKTGKTNLATYPYFKCPAATATTVSHCGSRFDVPAGETVTVTGLEGYARKNNYSSGPFPIRVHLMLCNLDANSKPILPPVDSVITSVSSVTTYSLIGGNFTTPRTMTTSFIVLIRNMSTVFGDTVHLYRTNGAINSNWLADPADRCSETDYGYVRFLGQFYSTREFTLAPGFGPGTDYEFMVAPRVTYSVQASQILPQSVLSSTDVTTVADTLCTRTELTFTNTSSLFFEHRMYNLNQFYRKWNLYSAIPQSVKGAFSSDSSITWHFEFYDGYRPDSRVFLPYVNSQTITVATDVPSTPNCFTANEFRARLKPMSAFGRGSQLNYNESFKVCFKYCYDDAVGISNVVGTDDLKIYPNPAIHGKTLITGLKGKNSITVYNVFGQMVLSEITDKDILMLDLSTQSKGTYMVKISGTDNQTRVIKVINQD